MYIVSFIFILVRFYAISSLVIAMEFGGVSSSVWIYVQYVRLLQEIVICSTKFGFIVNTLCINKTIDIWLLYS